MACPLGLLPLLGLQSLLHHLLRLPQPLLLCLLHAFLLRLHQLLRHW